MSQKIYLVIGTPGSGKSWVCNQLKDKFEYIPHDSYPKLMEYLNLAKSLADNGADPVLIETPFSVSMILGPLDKAGYDVTPVFILEDEETVSNRYEARENRPIPEGHLTRIQTYRERAHELQAFSGTSEEVLNYLKNV